MVDRLSEWGVYVYRDGTMVCGNRFITDGKIFRDYTFFNGIDNEENWIGTVATRITNPRLIHKELCGW